MIFNKRKTILAICMIAASTALAGVEEARSCNLYDVEIRKEKGIYERVYFNAALSDGASHYKGTKVNNIRACDKIR